MEKSIKKLVLAGLFLSLGLIMPFLTMQIPSIGSKLLPMHIPVLLCGFVCGWAYGLSVGFIVPILRSFLFTMPIMYPTALAMAFELAAYGFLTGYLFHKLPKRNISIYISLLIAMVGGRIVWGIASLILLGLGNLPFTLEIFLAGAVINALPGILVQIILIPILIMALKRAGLISDGAWEWI